MNVPMLVFTTCNVVSASALEKQRMAFKLQKFGVDPECFLIKINKEVTVVSNCYFGSVQLQPQMFVLLLSLTGAGT